MMHETLREGHRLTVDATSYACWVDGMPCEVVSPFLSRLQDATGDALATLAPYTRRLPCGRCRGAGKAAGGLRGHRLGRHARDILLRAAENPDGVIVAEEGITRAMQEARLRAARSLDALGLIVRRWRTQERTVERPLYVGWFNTYSLSKNVEEKGPGGFGPKYDVKRVYTKSEMTSPRGERYSVLTACLTPFGAALVEQYREELETGKPIRWDHRVSAALTACRQSPDELLHAFFERVKQSSEAVRDIAGKQARWARDGDNPGLREKARENVAEAAKGTAIIAAIIGEASGISAAQTSLRGVQRVLRASTAATCFSARTSVGIEMLMAFATSSFGMP